MLELKNISFAYGNRRVLDDISVSFAPGELCAVIGKNGCGKTTLARIMTRQIEPQGGDIILDGRNASVLSGRDFARRVSIFPQFRPIPDMTVRDYVAYGRYPYAGLSFRLGDEDWRAVESALVLTGTEAFSNRSVRELSGGERQLVYLAMQLAQDSDYMILDEPTASLDIANGFTVTDILTQAAARGKCVVAVIHDLAHALASFGRVVVVDSGKIIYDGSSQGAVEGRIIDDVFGVVCQVAGEKDYILRKKS